MVRRNNKYNCTRCPKDYIYKSGLSAHIKTKHPLPSHPPKPAKKTKPTAGAAATPRVVHDLINIGTQDLERLLEEEQELYDNSEEFEQNVGINESMVEWYNVNLHSSFSNTGEFASRAASVIQVKDCKDCKVNSKTFNKQRELLMKQEKKLEECHKKQKSSNEETKQLKIKLNQTEKVVKELRNRLELKNGSAVDISIKCNECEFSGKNMDELTEHKNSACSEALIRILTEEGPLNEKDRNCKNCSFRSTNRVILNEHNDKAHNGPIKCVTCGNISPNMENFRQHGKKHLAEIKMRNQSYPGMSNNFKCTPCKVSYKSNNELMDHLFQEHQNKANKNGTGLHKYNSSNKPPCRNGGQCRYHRQDRCMFLHDAPPHDNQTRQVPSQQRQSVPLKQTNKNKGHRVQQTRQEQTQAHRYWSIPPLWRESGDQRPWCKHGNMCPMGNYCVLRHQEEENFPNWSQQDQH